MVKQQIDEKKLDILKELANIGVGNAVTSLSRMLDEEKISMDVPSAELVLQVFRAAGRGGASCGGFISNARRCRFDYSLSFL